MIITNEVGGTITDVITTILVWTTVEGPGAVEFAVDEDVGMGGVQVDSETPVPLEKVEDALPPVMLELG